EDLDARLRRLLERTRNEKAAEDLLRLAEESRSDEVYEASESTPEDEVENSSSDDDPLTTESESEAMRPQLVARAVPQHQRLLYTRAQLPDASEHQHRFFENEYAQSLRKMALMVLQMQG